MTPPPSTTPLLRYFKLKDKDRYMPGEVLAFREAENTLFVVVEAQLATVGGSLLGDDPAFFMLAGAPYRGNWLPMRHRNTWRTSLESVPVGKAIPSRHRPLTPADIPVDIQLPSIPEKEEIELEGEEHDTLYQSFSSGLEGVLTSTRPTSDHIKERRITPRPPPSVLYEEPVFVNLPSVDVDSKALHHARQSANSVVIPNGKVYSGIEDHRSICDILRAANETSAYNSWTPIEMYFFIMRILSESVRRQLKPQPQSTMDGYADEVRRLCSQLHRLYSSETEVVQALYRWNALIMSDKQSLTEYLRVFEEARLQVERLQGSTMDDRVLKHKLLMTLTTVHRETGLSKMASLSYHELMHELVQLDRVRQLAGQHRKLPNSSNAKNVAAVEPIASDHIEHVCHSDNVWYINAHLRDRTLRKIVGNGDPVEICGLIDTGAETNAISETAMTRLIEQGAEVKKLPATCTAIMADGNPVDGCPVYRLKIAQSGESVETSVVVIKGLTRDLLVSGDVFRAFTSPTVWLFDNGGDRLFNVGSLSPRLRDLWNDFHKEFCASSKISPADIPHSNEDHNLTNNQHRTDSDPATNAPYIYGVTLQDVDDLPEEGANGLTDCGVSDEQEDPEEEQPTIDAPANENPKIYRYSHKIKWLGPRPSNDIEHHRHLANILEARLRRNGTFDLYDDEIRKFEQQGIIKRISPNLACFCLKHFPVTRKHGNELSSMRVRPVFDGSMLRGKICPNIDDSDKQHVTSCIHLLRRFSHFISCDFKAAFLQIEYGDELDKRHLCFWWRNILYSYQRVLFGLPDSPGALIHALADNIRTSREALSDSINLDPKGAYGIRILMDDLTVAAQTRGLAQGVPRFVHDRLVHCSFDPR
ncbi:hypothetical protein FOZ63_031653, partial [Perkinsus olseni]